MKHLAFLYYTIAYSIGLPTLAIVFLAWLKIKDKLSKYYLPFLISSTLLLICATVLQYQNANFHIPNSYSNVEAKYLYFIAESTFIFTMPLVLHQLIQLRKPIKYNIFFGFMFVISLIIIFSPIFLKYVPQQRILSALFGLKLYRLLFFLTMSYTIILLIINLSIITERLLKIFTMAALFFLMVLLFEVLQCELFPILNQVYLPIPLSPLGYFFLNTIFLIYAVNKIFSIPTNIAPSELDTASFESSMDQKNITVREKEIILLLVKGYSNKDITQCLYISDSTVKTHIKNIYRKLGIKNRVQLVNVLKGHI